jgi:hypothetical protein
MLKKTSYKETGPESVELSGNGNPTIVKADAIEAVQMK